jgi:hypothetical protein
MKKYGINDKDEKSKYKMKISVGDGDLSTNGIVRLADKLSIIDSGTGQVVQEMSVYQMGDDGGAGEIAQRGLRVIKTMPKGSQERQDGVEQYAKGRYANINSSDIERTWDSVDNISFKEAIAKAPTTNVDGASIKIIRLPYTTVDKNGVKNKEYVYHAVGSDAHGNFVNPLTNSTGYNRPDVIDVNTQQSVYNIGFKSVRDIKLELAKQDLTGKGIDFN